MGRAGAGTRVRCYSPERHSAVLRAESSALADVIGERGVATPCLLSCGGGYSLAARPLSPARPGPARLGRALARQGREARQRAACKRVLTACTDFASRGLGYGPALSLQHSG